MKEIIVTIGRQYGSGGREVGEKLAAGLGVPCYGKAELMELAAKGDSYGAVRSFYEEQPVDSLLYAIAMNSGTDPAEAPFRRIREFLGGKSCVLIGRCGNRIFRGAPDSVSVFLHADAQIRAGRVAIYEGISEKAARKRVADVDKSRAGFHRYYAREEWGAAENYDLCTDSGLLGVDGTAELIRKYLRMRGAAD